MIITVGANTVYLRPSPGFLTLVVFKIIMYVPSFADSLSYDVNTVLVSSGVPCVGNNSLIQLYEVKKTITGQQCLEVRQH